MSIEIDLTNVNIQSGSQLKKRITILRKIIVFRIKNSIIHNQIQTHIFQDNEILTIFRFVYQRLQCMGNVS